MTRRRVLAAVAIVAVAAVGYALWPDRTLTAAQAAADRRDFSATLALLDGTLDRSFPGTDALLLGARTARRAGQPGLAEKYLRRYVERGGDAEVAAIERVIGSVQRGESPRFDGGLTFCATHPGHPEVPFVLEAMTVGYLKANQLVKAADAAGRWIATNPPPADRAQALVWRATCSRHVGNDAPALADVTAAIDLAPDFADARVLAGDLLAASDPEAALARSRAALATDPARADARLGVARCHRNRGESGPARAELDAVLTAEPDHLAARVGAKLLIDAKEYPAAEADLRHALARSAKSRDALTTLARVQQLTGRDADAEATRAAVKAIEEDLFKLIREQVASGQIPAPPPGTDLDPPGDAMTRGLAVLLVLAAVGCGSKPTPPVTVPTSQDPPAAAGPGWFQDRTPGSGVEFTHRNGEEADHYTILESLGGGVALFDYDRDGKLDVFLTGGGHFEVANPPTIAGYPNRLYRNLGGWKFQDVTAAVGLDAPVFYSHGAAVGDYDRDGWPDLFVTGYRRVALFANRPDPADPTRRVFRETSRDAGIPDALPWSTSAAFGDLDGDGFDDLFVCQYLDWSFAEHRTCPHHSAAKDVCTPHAFRPMRPYLFRNTGAGKFVDVSDAAKLRGDGKGLGVVIADLDGDRRPDIYVANDASANHLYLNRGGMTFEECALARGVAVDETGQVNGSMGIAVADWDRSGVPSLLVTNFQNEFHALYQGVGPGRFAYRSQAAGLGRLGQSYVGFGTALADFDLDGWPDLAIANGHVLRHPVGSTLAQLPVLMRNVEEGKGRKLVNTTAEGGDYFRTPRRGRGLAAGDLDDDGRPDLVVSHVNAPAVLLRNRTGDGVTNVHNWVGFRLQREQRRPIVGATVTVSAAGRVQSAPATAGGYLSQNDSRLLFGFADARAIDRVTVEWPHGVSQSWAGPLAAGRWWVLTEGVAAATSGPTHADK